MVYVEYLLPYFCWDFGTWEAQAQGVQVTGPLEETLATESLMHVTIVAAGIKRIQSDFPVRGHWEAFTWFLWTSPHAPFLFTNFALYPFTRINHNHKNNYMLKATWKIISLRMVLVIFWNILDLSKSQILHLCFETYPLWPFQGHHSGNSSHFLLALLFLSTRSFSLVYKYGLPHWLRE